MKKIKILCIIAFLLFLAPSVYAGTAYAQDISIEAQINKDGSMTVKESILWEIEEDLNGVYRDILIKNPSNMTNSASDIAIESVVVDGEAFDYSYYTLQNGTEGQYNVNEIDGGKQIKIFMPLSDEYKRTVITYTLYDVIVEYNDIAELYWNFIGSGWEYGIYDLEIKIKLPEDTNTLKIFAHGPLHGYSSIPTSNMANVKVGNLRRGEQVDVRILFDTNVINAHKRVYENRLESILKEEEKLAIEANIKRQNAKKALYICIAVCILSLVLPILVYISTKRKAYKAQFKGKYYRELPEDYGPAVMNKIMHGAFFRPSSKDMLATLLDLVRRKYIEIEPILKNGKKKPQDYNLKLIKTDLTQLNAQEKHFIKKLIFVDTNEIQLKQLSKRNSKNSDLKFNAMHEYTKWEELIKEVSKEKELIKKQKASGAGKSVIGIILSIAVLIYGAIMNYQDIMIIGGVTTFIGIYELVYVIINLTDISSRTKKGVEHKAMWKAFKKFLQDFSKLDEHDYKSIAIWEHYLVYATALGISKKVIKQLKIAFPTEFEENSNMFATHMTIGLLSDNNVFSNFESAFSSATTEAFSMSSSSSGGGGGFSGGAGGRWWRRRWWRFLATK